MGNEVEAVHTPGAWHTVSENTPEKTPYVHGCILYLFNIHGNFIQPDPVLKKAQSSVQRRAPRLDSFITPAAPSSIVSVVPQLFDCGPLSHVIQAVTV